MNEGAWQSVIVSFFFYPGKKEEEEGELINSRGKHAFFLDEPVNASNFRRSCPPINPRSTCSSIYQFIGIDIDSNAIEGGEGRAKSELKRRRTRRT